MGNKTWANDVRSRRIQWRGRAGNPLKRAACSDPHFAPFFGAIVAAAQSVASAPAACGRCLALGRRHALGGAADAARRATAADGLRAGIEIRLAPGWKTYWRYPGDSGVPPRFDFAQIRKCQTRDGAAGRRRSGSPTERRHSIGYKGDVVFPLHVVPQDASRPVTLRLKLDYAVCEKLCVPAKGKRRACTQAGQRGRALRSRWPTGAVPRPLADRCEGRAIGQCRDARRQGQAAAHPCRCRRPRRRAAGCCSPKVRHRDGRCRSRSRSRARRTGCSASPSRSMACRPAPAPEAPT